MRVIACFEELTTALHHALPGYIHQTVGTAKES